jgi:hypothetical protein
MDEQQGEPRQRGRSINWLGLVAFIVIVFGRRIVAFVQWLFAGGTALLPGSFDPVLVLAGGAALAVVVAVLVTLRASGRGNAPMPPFGGPRVPSAPSLPATRSPTIMASPDQATRLPSAPRFEPIISPRAILFCALLTLLACGALAAFLLLQP